MNERAGQNPFARIKEAAQKQSSAAVASKVLHSAQEFGDPPGPAAAEVPPEPQAEKGPPARPPQSPARKRPAAAAAALKPQLPMGIKSTGVTFDLDVYIALREIKLMRSVRMAKYINDTLRTALTRDFPAIYEEAKSRATSMG